MINTEKSTLGNIDIAKFFFAVCIIALHTGVHNVFSGDMNFYIEKIFFRTAVPFFFVASGFFFGKKIYSNNSYKHEINNSLKKYCLRLFKPLVFFSLVNIAFQLVYYIYSKININTVLLKIGQSIVFYPLGALWYVQACIVGVVLLYPFLKKKKIKTALFIGVLLYSFALICNNYYFLVDESFVKKYVDLYLTICVSARNGLFTGFLFLAIGVFFSQHHNKMTSNKKLFFCTTVLSVIVFVLEIILLKKFGLYADDGSLYISHIIFIPFLFCALSIIPCKIDDNITVLLRNLSTGIYFLHRPVLFVVSFVVQSYALRFIIVLFVSIFICLFVYKTKMKFFYKILK